QSRSSRATFAVNGEPRSVWLDPGARGVVIWTDKGSLGWYRSQTVERHSNGCPPLQAVQLNRSFLSTLPVHQRRDQMRRKLFIGVVAIFMSLSAPVSMAAQDYPTRPIPIIVPYTPGDGPDVIARLIGEKISKRLGQPVVVENKAGASGQIGLSATANAAPDGYTLGVGLVTNLALAPHTYKNLPYDPLKDFTPVALAAMNYLALVARPDAPFKTVQEMTQWAKDNPGKLTIGTTSSGGLPHMSFELLANMSGFEFMNVPYKGNSAVVTDLTGGRTDLGVVAYTSVAPLIESGRLKLLGITNPTRDPALPDLPTIAESVEGYSAVGWF